MRSGLARCLVTLGLAACGGGSNSGVDAKSDAPTGTDVGFAKPTKSLKANKNTPTASGAAVWSELGPADLTCLGSASADTATTVPVTLTTTVRDFQTQNAVPSATVTAFAGIDVGTTFGSAVVTDGSGSATITIPVGTKRFGWKMTEAESLDTLLLNQDVDPSMATQTSDEIQIVSANTAGFLTSILNITRSPGTGIVAGALRDCQHREMSNFVTTMSSTPATTTAIDGSLAFYFATGTPPLPVLHSVQAAANMNGLFLEIQIPTSATAYVQAWGYVTDADLAADKLSLVSELQVPVIADTVITGSFEPLRK